MSNQGGSTRVGLRERPGRGDRSVSEVGHHNSFSDTEIFTSHPDNPSSNPTSNSTSNDAINEAINETDISPATKRFLEGLFDKLLHRLAESDAKVAVLTKELNRSKVEVRALRIELDDLQQYQRRHNVRIEGIECQEHETE